MLPARPAAPTQSQVQHVLWQTPEVLVQGDLVAAGRAILTFKRLGLSNEDAVKLVAYLPQVNTAWGLAATPMLARALLGVRSYEGDVSYCLLGHREQEVSPGTSDGMVTAEALGTRINGDVLNCSRSSPLVRVVCLHTCTQLLSMEEEQIATTIRILGKFQTGAF